MKLQKYFLGIVFSCASFVCAMEFESVPLIEEKKAHVCREFCAEKVRDDIDKILGVDAHAWFRSLRGSLASYWMSTSYYFEAISKLKAVEKIIRLQCGNKHMYRILFRKHNYFKYLVTFFITNELQALRDVRAGTIDHLCDKSRMITGLSHTINRFIRKMAQESYLNEMKLNNPLFQIPCVKEDIHLMHLPESFGRPQYFRWSTDEKYMAIVNTYGEEKYWDIDQGCKIKKITDDTEFDLRKYYAGYHYTDLKDRVMVICGYAEHIDSKLNTEVEVSNKKYGYYPISLFQRPTVVSCLFQQALQKQESKQDLLCLRDCQSVKDMKGFPKVNLLNAIEDKVAGYNKDIDVVIT